MKQRFSHISKRPLLIIIGLAIIAAFIFLRSYHIKQGLYFHNDMGRDFLTLLDWKQNLLRIPLLGPRSSLPIYQSPWYFYLLFPIYYLTNGWWHSIFTTANMVYISAFIWGVIYYSRNKKALVTILALSWLITIQPQVIEQNRYIWNPSFLLPFLAIAIFAWNQFLKTKSNTSLIVTSIFSGLAIGFSFSSIPIITALVIWTFFKHKNIFSRYFISLLVATGIVFLPNIIFDLRHNFIVAKNMYIAISDNQLSNWALHPKIEVYSKFIISMSGRYAVIVFSTLILSALISLTVFHNKISDNFKKLTTLFLLTMLITLIAPFPADKHYIFGPLLLLFLIIAQLPGKALLITLSLISIIWLKPSNLSNYFQPAPRTVTQLDTCFQKFCSTFNQPIFVSTQAFHYYHSGPEFQYLLKKHGCDQKDIYAQPDQAKHMLVVVDQSEYTHGKTSYNELTSFGESLVTNTFQCLPNLELITLKRY